MGIADYVHDRCIELGKHTVRMCTAAGSGHPSSSLSISHLVVSLMYKHMRYDVNNPWHPASDRLVLSEGHAVPIVYAAYADLGGAVGKSKDQARPLKLEELDTLREMNSLLDGHPNPAEGVPFFDAATGSLGQGLSVAAGLALAARLDGLDRRIYCICGDGESREGQVWEAADFIADHKLTNVCLIFNCNGQGQADYVSTQQNADSLTAKLKAFGWDAHQIDGHDPDQIFSALSAVSTASKPYAIVAKTTKGWGVSDLQDKSNHGKPLDADKMDAAMADLDAMRDKLHVSVKDSDTCRPETPSGPSSPAKASAQLLPAPNFESLLEGDGFLDKFAKNGKIATRRAFGLALRELGKINNAVVSLDADVSNSTFANYFAKQYPDRFFECKIAEQNMISAAAGLSAAGKVPFCSSFGKFLVRSYDQIEMAIISRANIKVVGSHVGVTLGADGPSQMALPDVAFFRSFPRDPDRNNQPIMTTFFPSDGVSAFKCTELMANMPGMCYLRTMRPDMGLLYEPTTEFRVGGSNLLRHGEDMLLAASGYMVYVAMRVAEQLEAKGIKAGVLDVYSFPLDGDPVVNAALKAGKKVLTVEDNFDGGVGSAIAEIAAERGDIKVQRMTVNRLPKSGKTPEDVLNYVGLGDDVILAAAEKLAK